MMQRAACITLRAPLRGICLAAPTRAARLNVRHTVKPGVTGWAAVNGWRGNTDLNERIRFDLELMMQRTACITLRVPLRGICLTAPTRTVRLIERWSLLFDAYIMLLTFSRNKNAY